MNRRAALAVAAAVLPLLALTACSSANAAVTDVSVEQAKDVVAQDDVRILDVRTAAEFEQGHLDGAINIDVTSPDFEAAVGSLPKEATWFVYCRSGNRSGVATDAMAELGFTSLYDLQGGVVDWTAAGGTLVT
jgi:rhodanese-related sulfurtransferase